MTTPKKIVCLCEDVTEHEVEEAVKAGYSDLESLKRYTGLATGPCQGKACLCTARLIMARAAGTDLSRVGGITFRPPVQPIPLKFLAAKEEKE
ncbi:MAG TPA: (2Fe-2S)-binding protein [Candidatus Thermoplasmatota archaeon]|nr:(2Fe-2S)-binding protein [Candidatus Thermoplasmatota archaeon]